MDYLIFLLSSRGGLEVVRLLHKLHDSTSVGSNPARHQKITVVIKILQEALSLIMFIN